MIVSSIPIIKAGVLDKFAVFIIDLIHCLRYGMRPGAKHVQLLAVMGDEVEVRVSMDTDKITIAKLPPEKWQEYKALRLQALQDDPQAFSEPFGKAVAYPDERWQQRAAEAYAGKESLIVFARAGEQLVGMVGAFFPPHETGVAEIFGVYVVPEARGKGIAKQLLDSLLHELKANPKIVTAKLSVNKGQLAAVKLYESSGFKVVGEENLLLGDGNYYDAYLMEMLL
jgi:ribosomal protein S18 acetylase RimI-like enzyme